MFLPFFRNPLGLDRVCGLFVENVSIKKCHFWPEFPENALFPKGLGAEGGPDPYHGWHTLIDRPRRTHYPGYHAARHCYTECSQHALTGPDRVHQASSEYSQWPKIPNCLKLPLFYDQNGPCQNWHFLTKSLPNPTLFLRKCHFWRFWLKAQILWLF